MHNVSTLGHGVIFRVVEPALRQHDFPRRTLAAARPISVIGECRGVAEGGEDVGEMRERRYAGEVAALDVRRDPGIVHGLWNLI